jgi:hypothetical protein
MKKKVEKEFKDVDPAVWSRKVAEAKEKLTHAKLNLLISKPFFGYIALRLVFVASYSAGGRKTTAITPNGIFYFNPDWVLGMSCP